MKISTKIGHLLSAMQAYKSIKLTHDTEVCVSDLGVKIMTPSTRYTNIEHIILKHCDGIYIRFTNNKYLRCASKHILYNKDYYPIYAEAVVVGDLIRTIFGFVEVAEITAIEPQDFYDVGICSPHVYADTNGIIHHNTIISAVLSHCCEKYGRTIVVVPNKSLVKQTEADYKNLELDVGVYYGDRKEFGHTHTICTWQSLNILLKNTKAGNAEDCTIGEFLEGVVCVMVDEAHQAKASVLQSLLTSIMGHVQIRWGLTGTIPKEEFEQRALQVSIGDVVSTMQASDLQDAGVLANCHVHVKQLVDHAEFKNYQAELSYLLSNNDRLNQIAKMIVEISKTGNTLVLVDRVAAGKALCDVMLGATFLSGATKEADRKEQYADVAVSDDKLIVATYGIAAVGINVPRLNNIILIEPGKSFVRVIQSIGRGLRKAADKDWVDIWDITSTCKFSKKHLTSRKKFYSEAKYPFSIEKINWR